MRVCNKVIIVSIFLCFFIISCGDDDLQAPQVVITNPMDRDTFSISDPIIVNGRVTDDVGLSSVQLVTDLNNEPIDLDFDDPVDYLFEISLELDLLTQPGDYELSINGTDGAGNFGEQKITIIIIE